MRLTLNQFESASLAWIYDVYVQEGEMKDPGRTEYHKLIVAARPSSVKPSRMDETALHIILDKVDDNVLSDIREKLLKNASLAEVHEKIREGKWYKAATTITYD